MDHREPGVARRNQEPWIPVNNFPPSLTIAKKLVAIYSQRMQIEEGFRDVKSPLFGLDFGMNQTRSERRIEILLMIAMLASLVILACGLKVRHEGQIKQFQINSIRSRSVLSLWRVGHEAILHLPCLPSRSRLHDLADLIQQEASAQHESGGYR
ncbi:transposase [Billgrantia sp. C5P2]|uniref:transposase n=1 Tax=Billgrantia sp. C5P2 TaxID=3436239 RepID=UPI003DA61BBE